MVKCPKCEAAITHVQIQALDGTLAHQSRWKCIAYTCPHCSYAISVQMDPIALKKDTVDAVVQALQGKP